MRKRSSKLFLSCLIITVALWSLPTVTTAILGCISLMGAIITGSLSAFLYITGEDEI